MMALLNGEATPNIVSFEATGQQRKVVCTDSEVLSYLKEIILRHPPITSGAGCYVYEGYFKFEGGGTLEAIMLISISGFDLCMDRREAFMGDSTHSVPLSQPQPEKLRQMFAFFEEPWETAAGKVTILENGVPPRTQSDSSLIAK